MGGILLRLGATIGGVMFPFGAHTSSK
jgi:hypothetical protein